VVVLVITEKITTYIVSGDFSAQIGRMKGGWEDIMGDDDNGERLLNFGAANEPKVGGSHFIQIGAFDLELQVRLRGARRSLPHSQCLGCLVDAQARAAYRVHCFAVHCFDCVVHCLISLTNVLQPSPRKSDQTCGEKITHNTEVLYTCIHQSW